jgi:similar to stage IV sporulation protein
LAWVNVQVQGTLATIFVAEKAIPDVQLNVPGDVVAAKDGVVEELVTLRGIPVIAEGEVVHAGQLLISGLLPPQDPAHKEKVTKGEPPYLHADGIVKAQVWHEGVAEADFTWQEEERTGNVNRRLLWQWKNRSGSVGRSASFTRYKERLITLQPGVGRFRLPGRLTMEERAEVVIHSTPLDPDAVRENALAAAWEQVQAALPTGAVMYQPPQVQVEVVSENSKDFVRARVSIVAIEDIKLFEPVPTQGSKVGVSRPVLGPPPTVQPVPGP